MMDIQRTFRRFTDLYPFPFYLIKKTYKKIKKFAQQLGADAETLTFFAIQAYEEHRRSGSKDAIDMALEFARASIRIKNMAIHYS